MAGAGTPAGTGFMMLLHPMTFKPTTIATIQPGIRLAQTTRALVLYESRRCINNLPTSIP
ncbi:MAG: hypothetical protein NTAFB09_17310 [Nitrosospira sp.]